ncbi:C39 family peptidase [Tumebacillus flagellatus]|nr:C39 family peptidase [Tumebacillus flagellatus]
MIPQNPQMPTGCEIASLTMLLHWAGHPVSKTEVAGWVHREPAPYQRNGVWYGGDPHRGFIGSPDSPNGYGVFHEPIYQVLQKKEPARAFDLTGNSFTSVLQSVDQGSPVITWVTIGLAEPRSSMTWRTGSGKTIDWKTPEHATVLTGYSATTVSVQDPLTGRLEHYPRSLFQKRWEQMGQQAVGLRQE